MFKKLLCTLVTIRYTLNFQNRKKIFIIKNAKTFYLLNCSFLEKNTTYKLPFKDSKLKFISTNILLGKNTIIFLEKSCINSNLRVSFKQFSDECFEYSSNIT